MLCTKCTAENSNCVMDRNEMKKKFADSETKHFVRIPDKNAENTIFWTNDKDAPIAGEGYNAGSHCWSKERKGSPIWSGWKAQNITGLSVCTKQE